MMAEPIRFLLPKKKPKGGIMSGFYNEEMAAQQERMARTKDMVHQRSQQM